MPIRQLLLLFFLFSPGGVLAPAFEPPPPGLLREVIPALFGPEVLRYDGAQAPALKQALEESLRLINARGLSARRVNEIGNAVEPLILEALLSAGFSASRPTALSGQQRSAGYPDLEAKRGEDAFYFEIKTYHPRTEDSSQRTFYMSPARDPKVTHAAFHLLIGYAIEPAEDGTYYAKSVRLVDLSDLPVKLKIEYNASNRELYSEPFQLLQIEAGTLSSD